MQSYDSLYLRLVLPFAHNSPSLRINENLSHVFILLRSAQADHVFNKLFPKEKEPTDRITKMLVVGGFDDAALEVEFNLMAEFALDLIFQVIGVWDAEVVIDKSLLV